MAAFPISVPMVHSLRTSRQTLPCSTLPGTALPSSCEAASPSNPLRRSRDPSCETSARTRGSRGGFTPASRISGVVFSTSLPNHSEALVSSASCLWQRPPSFCPCSEFCFAPPLAFVCLDRFSNPPPGRSQSRRPLPVHLRESAAPDTDRRIRRLVLLQPTRTTLGDSCWMPVSCIFRVARPTGRATAARYRRHRPTRFASRPG